MSGTGSTIATSVEEDRKDHVAVPNAGGVDTGGADPEKPETPIDFSGMGTTIAAGWIAARIQKWFRLSGPLRYALTIFIGILITGIAAGIGGLAVHWAPPAWNYVTRQFALNAFWQKAEPGKMAVVITQLDDDPDGVRADWIAQELKKNFGDGVQVVVEPATMNDSWSGQKSNRADEADQWIEQSSADVLVWGRVWYDGSYSVRIRSKLDATNEKLYKTNIPPDRIDLSKSDSAPDDEHNVSAISAVGGAIVTKALQSAWTAYAAGVNLSANLDPVIKTLVQFVERVSSSEQLNIRDKVALVSQFEEIALAYENHSGKIEPLRDHAIPALQHLLQDKRLATPSEAVDLIRTLQDFGNALNEVAKNELAENDPNSVYRLNEHDLAIRALSIAASGSSTTKALLALTGTPDGWPPGSTIIDVGKAQLDEANAFEARGEARTFGLARNTADGLADLQMAEALHKKAIESFESYRPTDPSERLKPSRPRDQLLDPRHFELSWAEAQDMLGLDLINIAKVSAPNPVDLSPAFIALGNAAKARRPDASWTDSAITLARLGEAYRVDGARKKDLAELARARVCFEQAYVVLGTDNPDRNRWILDYENKAKSASDELMHGGAYPLANDPPAHWPCAPPAAKQIAVTMSDRRPQ